MYEQIG
jgi:hypothetical protein